MNITANTAQYIGTKLINAAPMTRKQYNELRGWEVPPDENPADPGFLVEYLDGGKSNHPEFKGYISWSPAEVFLRAYHPTHSNMSFGDALVALRDGMKVARKGWNGKDMFLFLVPGTTFTVNRPPLLDIYQEGTPIQYSPHIDMKTADEKIVPWLASQTDMLAYDWCVV